MLREFTALPLALWLLWLLWFLVEINRAGDGSTASALHSSAPLHRLQRGVPPVRAVPQHHVPEPG